MGSELNIIPFEASNDDTEGGILDSDFHDMCRNADRDRMVISDLFGKVFRKILKNLTPRQKEIVDLVKSKLSEGAGFDELSKAGYSLAEVMELVKIGVLKPSKKDDGKVIYREFLIPKKQ